MSKKAPAAAAMRATTQAAVAAAPPSATAPRRSGRLNAQRINYADMARGSVSLHPRGPLAAKPRPQGPHTSGEALAASGAGSSQDAAVGAGTTAPGGSALGCSAVKSSTNGPAAVAPPRGPSLGEIPSVREALSKCIDDEALKRLHRTLYGSDGKHTVRATHLSRTTLPEVQHAAARE